METTPPAEPRYLVAEMHWTPPTPEVVWHTFHARCGSCGRNVSGKALAGQDIPVIHDEPVCAWWAMRFPEKALHAGSASR